MATQSDVSQVPAGGEAPGPTCVLLPALRRAPELLRILVGWRGLLVLCVGVLVAWRFLKAGTPVPPALFVSLIGSVVGVAGLQKYLAVRRARRRAGRLDDKPSDDAPRTKLREALQPGHPLQQRLLQAPDEEAAVAALSSTDFAGEAVCLASGPHRWPADLEPLAVPFEPMVLDAASARLLVPLNEPARRGLDFADVAKWARRVTLVLRRAGLLEGTNFVVLVSLVFSLLVAGPLNRSVLTRAVIIAIPVLLFLRSERVAGHLYLVPGGLIDARRKHVYRRASGLMVWCADSRMLYVLDAGPSPALSFTVTPSEARVALRAWLSPVPGPSDELVQSFLNGG